MFGRLKKLVGGGGVRINASQIRRLILVSELPGGPNGGEFVLQAFEQMNSISDLSPLSKSKPTLKYVHTSDKDKEIFNICKPGGSTSFYIQSGGPNSLITVVEDGKGEVNFTGEDITLA